MLIQNAVILDENFQLARKDILVEGDRIVATGTGFSTEGQEVVDASGLTAVPGFVDIHIHGCDGEDASNGTVESIRTMARFLLKKGVTSFCPTTMTLRKSRLHRPFPVRNTAWKIRKKAPVCWAFTWKAPMSP